MRFPSIRMVQSSSKKCTVTNFATPLCFRWDQTALNSVPSGNNFHRTILGFMLTLRHGQYRAVDSAARWGSSATKGDKP